MFVRFTWKMSSKQNSKVVLNYFFFYLDVWCQLGTVSNCSITTNFFKLSFANIWIPSPQNYLQKLSRINSWRKFKAIFFQSLSWMCMLLCVNVVMCVTWHVSRSQRTTSLKIESLVHLSGCQAGRPLSFCGCHISVSCLTVEAL